MPRWGVTDRCAEGDWEQAVRLGECAGMFLERVRRERVLQRLVRAHGATLGPRGLETLGKRPVGVLRKCGAVLLSDALRRTRNACCALVISACRPDRRYSLERIGQGARRGAGRYGATSRTPPARFQSRLAGEGLRRVPRGRASSLRSRVPGRSKVELPPQVALAPGHSPLRRPRCSPARRAPGRGNAIRDARGGSRRSPRRSDERSRGRPGAARGRPAG